MSIPLCWTVTAHPQREAICERRDGDKYNSSLMTFSGRVSKEGASASRIHIQEVPRTGSARKHAIWRLGWIQLPV